MLQAMAKVVDHEVRRREVLDATWRVIARQGIDGASVRAIAHEVGWSTGVLAHYFVNKDEILLSALQLMHARVMERAHRRASESSGARALFTALTETLPIDASRLLEAQVEVAFWGRAVANRRLNDIQHDEFDKWASFVLGLAAATAERRELTSAANPEKLAVALIAVVDGVELEAALFPERLTPRRQLDALLATLRPALTPKASAAVAAAANDLLSNLGHKPDQELAHIS
jgi:AcrR family transcriptional regulator